MNEAQGENGGYKEEEQGANDPIASLPSAVEKALFIVGQWQRLGNHRRGFFNSLEAMEIALSVAAARGNPLMHCGM